MDQRQSKSASKNTTERPRLTAAHRSMCNISLKVYIKRGNRKERNMLEWGGQFGRQNLTNHVTDKMAEVRAGSAVCGDKNNIHSLTGRLELA